MRSRTVVKTLLAEFSDSRLGRRASKTALRVALFAYGYNRFDNFALSGEAWLISTKLPTWGVTGAIDCGANRGSYSRLLLRSIQGRVIAVDPDARVVGHLEAIKNEFPDRFEYLNLALGRSDESGMLHLSHDPIWSTLMDEAPDYVGQSEVGMQQVVIRSVDSLADGGFLDEINFLKIDAEGLEFEILSGAEKTLRSGQFRAIQFEFGVHNLIRNQSLAKLCTLMPNYQLTRLHKGKLIPVDPHDPLDSIPLFANYVAVHVDL